MALSTEHLLQNRITCSLSHLRGGAPCQSLGVDVHLRPPPPPPFFNLARSLPSSDNWQSCPD
jgi:hypothetical protein